MTEFFNMNKKNHPLAGTVICKNNFFNNPEKVLELAKKLTYERSERYPGKRTINLLESTDTEAKNFAMFFARKIMKDVFPGISRFVTHISFHINDVYDNDTANTGWIHNDNVRLAGLVYLNPEERNFDTGTSIFIKHGEKDFENSDLPSRKEFNITQQASEQYLKDLESNHNNLQETIKIGNVYNRLIAYDSNLWHRPNNYKTASVTPRTTLLFFIDFYEFTKPDVEDFSGWID